MTSLLLFVVGVLTAYLTSYKRLPFLFVEYTVAVPFQEDRIDIVLSWLDERSVLDGGEIAGKKSLPIFSRSRTEKMTRWSLVKLMSPLSNALSYRDERQMPFSGFSRSCSFSAHGMMWLATRSSERSMPVRAHLSS